MFPPPEHRCFGGEVHQLVSMISMYSHLSKLYFSTHSKLKANSPWNRSRLAARGRPPLATRELQVAVLHGGLGDELHCHEGEDEDEDAQQAPHLSSHRIASPFVGCQHRKW